MTQSKEFKDAQQAALRYITSREEAENFRDPENATRAKQAGKATSVAYFDLSKGGITAPELQKALDAIADGAQEELRLATQLLVIAERGEQASAQAITTP